MESSSYSEKSVAADIELISLLKSTFAEKNILLMDVLCSTYREILKMDNVTDVDVKPEMIKKKILENIEDVEFSRPNRQKCEMVCSVATKKCCIRASFRT